MMDPTIQILSHSQMRICFKSQRRDDGSSEGSYGRTSARERGEWYRDAATHHRHHPKKRCQLSKD